MMRRSSQQGFTLVELLLTVAVIAILAMMAAPSFNGFFDKFRVKRAAETVSAFLINAKSEAVKRNRTVNAVFTGSGATWCAGMTEAATCNCTTAGACQIDGVDRVISSASFKGVELDGLTSPHEFNFEPLLRNVDNDTVELESAEGLKINVAVSRFGRIRLCSPGSSVGGYPAC
jgi:type IV fimbrial biogenesis protein FimT